MSNISLYPSTICGNYVFFVSSFFQYLNLYFHTLFPPQSYVSSPLLARHLILCKLIAHHMGCDMRLVSIQIIVCVSSPRECAANLLCVHLPNDSCLHTASLKGSLSQCDFLHFNKALAPQTDKDTQTHSPCSTRHTVLLQMATPWCHQNNQETTILSLTEIPKCSRLSHWFLCEWCYDTNTTCVTLHLYVSVLVVFSWFCFSRLIKILID